MLLKQAVSLSKEAVIDEKQNIFERYLGPCGRKNVMLTPMKVH